MTNSWRVVYPQFPGENTYVANLLCASENYFPSGMINPCQSKHQVSEPMDDLTSGIEDQDLSGGKRHKPNTDHGVGNHEVVKPALPASPAPIPVKVRNKVGDMRLC